MKKTILKTVVAATVVAVTMALGSIAAFAATYEYYRSTGTVNTKDYFTVTESNSSASALVDTSSLTNAAGEALNIQNGIKFNSGGKAEFTTSATNATLTVQWSPRKDQSNKCTLTLDGTEISSATGVSGTDVLTKVDKYAIPTTGAHILKQGTGESVVYYIRVDETPSATDQTYTITGTSNLNIIAPDVTSFKLGNYTANVDAAGSWTVSQTAASAPFGVNTQLDVSLDGYTANPSTVTLTAGTSDTNFSGGSITFEEQKLTAIEKGTYKPADIEKGLPNFDISDLVRDTTSGKYKSGNVKFILSGAAKITVNGKCGSGDSDTTKKASVWLDNVNYTSNASDAPKDYVFYAAAGTKELNFSQEGGTTFQVVSITIEYINITEGLHTTTNGGVYVSGSDSYLIAKVSDSDLSKSDLTIKLGNKSFEPTTKVYPSLQIGEKLIEAKEVGGSYLYAVKITGADGNAAVDSFTAE